MLYCTDLLQVCVSHSKEECHTTYEEVCKPVYHKPTYQTAAHNGKECEQVPKKECKYVQVNNNNDSTGHMSPLQLETKVIQMFPKISQSRRRPLLGPSSG